MTDRLRQLILGVALVALVAAPLSVRAQGFAPLTSSVEASFADAVAKEGAVRKALGIRSPSPSILKAVREVVTDYESLARRHASSGFSDDALWRAARLAGDAFEVFGDVTDQSSAVRLLQFLSSQYPGSSFTKQAPAHLASLNATSAMRPPLAAAPAPSRARVSAAPASPASLGRVATIKDIRRSSIGDIVRVVIELDMEVASFHDERLENPARVFVDLPATRAAAPLKDQTLRFDGDSSLIRQIRIGRHPNNTTRVVLDADGISSYSIYPLYSPYRLVIDCLNATVSAAGAGAASVLARVVSAPAPATPATFSAAPPPLVVRRHAAFAPAAPMLLPSLAAVLVEDEPAAGEAAPPALPITASTASGSTLPLGVPSRNLDGGFSIARQLGLGVSRIVIDPGHGGHDPGAKGGGTTEADLVLDVSLRLEKLLARLPGVEVALTRRADQYVTLQERTAFANRENADLFLSIHANASGSSQAQGIETYFLNFATNLSTAALAARENAASGQNMGELPDVVKTIALNNKLDESRDFATYVQREMMAKLRPSNRSLRDLGVKQAPFVVLIGASMPSVLAEISFLTNPKDAKLLKTGAYRQKIAEALFEAIHSYQASLRKNPSSAQQSLR